MCLLLTQVTNRSCDIAHAQWPVCYNSIDNSGQIVNIITRERIVVGCSKLVEG